MRRLILPIALLLPLPIFAQDPAPIENLYPLEVGNIWTYRVSGQEDRFVVRAVRIEMIGDQTCMLLEARIRGRVVATEHLAFTKAGLCRFREDNHDVVPPLPVLRTDARRGSWGGSKTEYRLSGRTIAPIFATRSEEITVLGKKYKTIYVKAVVNEGSRLACTSEIWYASGVGPVKQTINETKRAPLVLELDKFEKGKGE